MLTQYRFLLLMRFEVAANKNHTILSERARDTEKLKKGNFWLPRIRKECAPEFKTLADYVIPLNNFFYIYHSSLLHFHKIPEHWSLSFPGLWDVGLTLGGRPKTFIPGWLPPVTPDLQSPSRASSWAPTSSRPSLPLKFYTQPMCYFQNVVPLVMPQKRIINHELI